MANYANPRSFTRYCGLECAQRDESEVDENGKPHNQLLHPIGVWSTSTKAMTHAFKCNHEGCTISGSIDDIVRHERLQHGTIYSHRPFRYHFEVIDPTESFEKYQVTPDQQKFSHILEGSTMRKGHHSDRFKLDDRTIHGFHYCDLRFHNGCRMAIDMVSTVIEKDTTDDYNVDRISYGMEIYFQPRANSVPIQLLRCSSVYTLEDCASNGNGFANSKALSSFMECLGLDSEPLAIELFAELLKGAVDPYCLEDLSRPYAQDRYELKEEVGLMTKENQLLLKE